MSEHPDLIRLRSEYAERARNIDLTDRYSLSNLGQLFTIQQRQRAVLRCLKEQGFLPLERFQILELGCGTGGVLLEMLSAGAAASHLIGCDLLIDRLQLARQRLPGLRLACSDGQNLPYPDGCFDLVIQYTVFSSVLDTAVKENLAREILRVTRPSGMVLWYDFWINPTNPQTRGIRPDEIRRLFPGCRIVFHRTTLAPPIARLLARISWGICVLFESLKICNTHYLATIRPRRT